MASSINASTSGAGGVITTADSSGVLNIQTAGNTAVTVDASQNVGIGTTTPSSILHVRSSNGRIISNASSATGNPSLLLKTSSANNRDWEVYQRYTNGDFGIYDGVGGLDRLLIDTSGRVGIATTGNGQLNVGNGQGFNPPSASPQITLAAAVLSGNYGGGLSILDGTTGYSLWAESSGANFYIRRGSTSTAYTGGVALINAATSWSSASDENIKDIIEPIENAIEKVSTLRTVIGKYKDEEEGIRHPFLIAQDVEKVLPEAVCIMHEGEDNECLGLSYTDTIPLLVAAIQEQQTIINDLKARIETLEAK
jgi:hypothetical protein